MTVCMAIVVCILMLLLWYVIYRSSSYLPVHTSTQFAPLSQLDIDQQYTNYTHSPNNYNRNGTRIYEQSLTPTQQNDRFQDQNSEQTGNGAHSPKLQLSSIRTT